MLPKDGVRVEPLVIVGTGPGPETKDQTLVETVPGAVSVAEVPVGALVEVGKVMALSGPALATGGMLAQSVPLQVVPVVQVAATVIPLPEGGVGTIDLVLLLRKKVLELYGIVTRVLVPESALPVVTGGAITVPGAETPLLLVLLVTLEPRATSGLVTVQERVVVQLLALRAMVQGGADMVPDMMRAFDTTTCILSVCCPPLLSVTVRRKT